MVAAQELRWEATAAAAATRGGSSHAEVAQARTSHRCPRSGRDRQVTSSKLRILILDCSSLASISLPLLVGRHSARSSRRLCQELEVRSEPEVRHQ